MSSPTEKNSDKKGCKRSRTEGLSTINLISQPRPPVPLFPPIKTNSPSTSSSDEFSGLTTEEKDLQLAHNLILLSQSGNLIDQAAVKQASGTPTSQSQPPSIEVEKVSAEVEVEIAHDTIVPSCQPVQSTAQTIRRHYPCNICNKKFNSFQALGGHRAKHRKMKLKSDEPEVQSLTETGRTASDIVLKLDDITNIQKEIQVNSPVAKHPVVTTNNKARLHRCQQCPAVFHSGQALGGHMRKHNPLNGGGDASKNKKAKVATQEPPSNGIDGIAIQPPNASPDRVAIQQPAFDDLDGNAIQPIVVQQQPDGALDRIGIVQQQANGGFNLDVNLPVDQVDSVQQTPAVQPHDADPHPTIKFFGTYIKLPRD